ncbi:hypothetical protein VN23_16745 [Janthinobacterium sp. B9-8]|nr:hypothetical protein VN23_16745 [Janthinobacterium sp. B9-8]
MGVVSDKAGNIYVADYCNNRIRKITKSGVVSTYAGNGVAAYVDGPAISASLYLPQSIAIDKNENIYVEDGNSKIRKIDRNGTVSTIAINGLIYPKGIAVDGRGNIFVSSGDKILKITLDGAVKTIAGGNLAGFSDGVGELALFDQPQGIAIDQYGTIYVADSRNNRIRKIAENGAVTTLAGNGNASLLDGAGNSASFNYPSDVAIDALGQVYVVDAWNHRVRKVSQNGAVNTLSYLDGSLHAIAVSVDGSLYISRLLDSAEVITKIVY